MVKPYGEQDNHDIKDIPGHQESPTENIDQIIDIFQTYHHDTMINIDMQIK